MQLAEVSFQAGKDARLSFRRGLALLAYLVVSAVSSLALPSTASARNRCEIAFAAHENLAPIAARAPRTTIQDIFAFAQNARFRKSGELTVEAIFDELKEKSQTFARKTRDAELRGALDQRRKEELIVEYHESFFEQFRDPVSLGELRNRSLRDALRRHGATIDSNNAKAELKKLSRENRDRIEKRARLKEPWIRDREIDEMVENLEIRFDRNANQVEIAGGVILSSRRMADYGFEGGLNSYHSFNKDFLRSDDQVFFFVKLRSPKKPGGESSRYGHVQQSLDEAEASRNLWISPFVMYEEQLASFARTSLDGYAGKNQNDLVNLIGREGAGPVSHEATEIRNALHNFDFTHEDFLAMVKLQMRKSLTAIKYNPLKRFGPLGNFAAIKRRILIADPPDMDDLFKALVLDPLRLPRMEGKVPVALAASSIKSVRTSSSDTP